MVACCDVHNVAGLLQANAATVLRVETVQSKVAEVACGIAGAGDGELQVTWPTVIQHLANELEGALLRPSDGLGEINLRADAVALTFRPNVCECAHD
jgi:hypothetical protein